MLDWIDIKQDGFNYYLTCKRSKVIISPLEAAHYTIKYITEKYPPPYTLMLSGGIDSQAMLYAWYTSKVPFNTLAAMYNYKLNQHDLTTLQQFSDNHYITINYENFDLINFLFNEHESYVHKYRCGSPHMTTFMKLSEQVREGTVIMSGNIIPPRRPTLPITKNNFALYRYAKENNRHMVPFFFLETDQLACSFDQYISEDISYPNPKDTQPLYRTRIDCYRQGGFPVIPQEQKFTGFEVVKKYFDENYTHLVTFKDKLAISSEVNSRRTFDLLFRNKYELKYSSDKYSSRVEYA